MTVAPFTSKGAVAEWRLVYRVLAAANQDATVPYDALSEALGREVRDDRQPVYRAQKELEEKDSRSVECVPTVGYRIVKGIRTATATDRSQLSSQEQQALDGIQERLTRAEQMLRFHGRRIKEVEARTDEAEQVSRDTAAELADLKAKLAQRGYLDGEKAA